MTDLKKGDVIRFAHEAHNGDRANHTIANVGVSATTRFDYVELEDMTGQFAPHLFIRVRPL